MRHFLKLEGAKPSDLRKILNDAKKFKKERGKSKVRPLEGQTWGLLFSKPSTRTRVSFEVAVRELGGQVIFLAANDMQLGRGEPIQDTARVLGRMLHGIVCRTFAQSDVEKLAEYSKLPTVNALTDDEHPCQIMADIFTYEEKRGSIKGKKVAFIGDASCNVPRSWVYASELLDFELVCAAPKKFQSPVKNANTKLVSDPKEAAKGADLLYTDVWVSMGKEDEAKERIKAFKGYQINESLVKVAARNAVVMHCLPAYRGKEISAETMEDYAQDIFDQAENRLHVQKAILNWMVTTK